MGRNLTYGVLGISLLVFMLAVGFLIFSDQPQTENDTEDEPEVAVGTSTDDEPEDVDQRSPTGSQATTSVDAEVFDADEAQSSCVEEREEELEQEDYESGELLISFSSDASFSDAERIIDIEGAAFVDDDDAEDEFDDQGWLEVEVPEGEEAQYMCRFDRYPEVRTVRANVTFNLRE